MSFSSFIISNNLRPSFCSVFIIRFWSDRRRAVLDVMYLERNLIIDRIAYGQSLLKFTAEIDSGSRKLRKRIMEMRVWNEALNTRTDKELITNSWVQSVDVTKGGDGARNGNNDRDNKSTGYADAQRGFVTPVLYRRPVLMLELINLIDQ